MLSDSSSQNINRMYVRYVFMFYVVKHGISIILDKTLLIKIFYYLIFILKGNIF